MKNVVIAAGYATRLGELTRNFPKPLLKIGDCTILDLLLKDIDTIDDIDEHIIVTNHRFYHCFEEWSRQVSYKKKITIIDDGTETNETRLGAVCDLLYAIEECQINTDMLLIAADNIVSFSFKDFVSFSRLKKASCIMCHEQNNIDKLRRTGVVVLDDQDKVIEMEEKPHNPKSHLAVPPFYIYLQKDLGLILSSISNGCGKDAPGNLAHYLVEHTDIFAWRMTGNRFDIGSVDSYKEACNNFAKASIIQK